MLDLSDKLSGIKIKLGQNNVVVARYATPSEVMSYEAEVNELNSQDLTDQEKGKASIELAINYIVAHDFPRAEAERLPMSALSELIEVISGINKKK